MNPQGRRRRWWSSSSHGASKTDGRRPRETHNLRRRRQMACFAALSPPSPPAPPPPPQRPRFRRFVLPTRSCERKSPAKIRGSAISKLVSGSRGESSDLVPAALPEDVAEDTSTASSVHNQLDLLEQLASGSDYNSDGDSYRQTIHKQLTELVDGRVGEVSIPLGKKLKVSMKSLTLSQRRNIKRQAYLNEVSQRNDSRFFAMIGAFVLLPPAIILAVAILTGYVQLFP